MKRVLLVNETSTFKSGLGKYGFNLLKGLKKRGYDVAELGFGNYINSPDDGPAEWPLYYNNVPQSDPRFAEMERDPDNKFGKWRFAKTCLDFRPDYVLSILDPWHSKFINMDPTRRFFNFISMPTADTFPLKPKWHVSYTNPDVVLSYSDWAKDQLNQKWPTLNVKTARYGVDPTHFHPLPHKKEVKSRLGIDENACVIGMVGKNQPRKLFAEMIFMFKQVLDKYSDAKLYMHTCYPDRVSWDIPSILNQSGTANSVLFTYTCGKCQNVRADIYTGSVKKCDKCSGHCSINSPGVRISEEKLNEIYNSFDIYLQYSCSEGAGMPVAEAAYCGLPTVICNTTAMKDYRRTIRSFPISVHEQYTYNEHGFRGMPDNNYCVHVLESLLHGGSEHLEQYGEEGMHPARSIYNWDTVCDVWAEAIESVEPKNLWDSPKKVYNIPNHKMDSFQMFNFLQDHLEINDPYNLLKMCRDSEVHEFGYMNGFLSSTTKESIQQQITAYTNQLNIVESIRCGEMVLPEEDFIDYANIKRKIHAVSL